MPQQSVNLGGSAAKGYKRIQGGPTSPAGEDLVPEPGACGRRKNTFIFEQAVGVS
jgi:hypothetical protein